MFDTQSVYLLLTNTPLKSNIDTKNDGVLNVPPFKYGYFGYPS